MIKKEDLPACPVATTVQMIGSKWKLLIIRNLLNGKMRYLELHKSLPGISQKVLTSTLKSMVEDGIVTRISYQQVPLKVEYSLSELGMSLKPIIDDMAIWGNEYKNINKQSIFVDNYDNNNYD